MIKLPSILLLALFASALTPCFSQTWPHSGKFGAGTRYVYVYNELDRDIWVYFKAHLDPLMKADSFALAKKTNKRVELPNRWNSGLCFGTYEKESVQPFVTLAEWTLGGVGSNADFYDISLVDAFSVPLILTPVPGTFTKRPNLPADQLKYDCGTAICTTDILKKCPDYLKWNNSSGVLIACLGGCQAAARGRVDASLRTWYCCEPPHGTPETCPTNPIATMFKAWNPDAYSYPYDDNKSTYVCQLNPTNMIGPDYYLIFGSTMPAGTAVLNPDGSTTPAPARSPVTISGISRNGFTVRLPSPDRYDLKLVSISGKTMRSMRGSAASIDVSTARLPAGVYFVKVQGAFGQHCERITVR